MDFNGQPACECEDGYSGDSCERRDGNLIFIVIVYLFYAECLNLTKTIQ